LATVGGKKLIHERNSQFFFFARIATEKPEVGKEEVGLVLSEREKRQIQTARRQSFGAGWKQKQT
jgi:hypothetical protein